MRLDRAIVSALGASQIANGLLVVPPAPQTADVVARQPPVEHTERDTASSSPEELWKRRGGGGGGGRGGGGGGSRGGGGGNSGSGSGSRSGSSSTSSGSSSRGSASSKSSKSSSSKSGSGSGSSRSSSGKGTSSNGKNSWKPKSWKPKSWGSSGSRSSSGKPGSSGKKKSIAAGAAAGAVAGGAFASGAMDRHSGSSSSSSSSRWNDNEEQDSDDEDNDYANIPIRSSGRGSPSSNAGGRTTTGSGPPPAYGGGKYYGGGAVQPLKPGTRTASGINPVLLGVGLGALAFWPGLWLYGAYSYHYNNPYRFHNETHDPPENQTKPIICACDPYMPCGCDENGDQAYLNDLIGNGSYSHLNHTLITVANVNGTETILINGTLPNGTTAAGGTEDPYSAGTGMQLLLENAGWWPLLATVGAAVFLG